MDALVLLMGLLVGSFLGLVSHRLPVMLERSWRAQCAAISGANPVAGETYNLWRPASHCPHCNHRLGPLENVPLLSWLAQGGRCRACQAPIGWREPAIELASAALAWLAYWRYGATLDAALVAACLWALLVASSIDLQRQWLPDQLTLPLLWTGLLVNLDGRFIPLDEAVLGAAAGYLVLWAVSMPFQWLTGREGMGEGDFKLLAAIGAWAGWQALPGMVLTSSILGVAWGLAAITLLKRSRGEPMPFGPMLSLAGGIAILVPTALPGAFGA